MKLASFIADVLLVGLDSFVSFFWIYISLPTHSLISIELDKKESHRPHH